MTDSDGSRGGLDRAEIMAAAVRLVDRSGVRTLTMRRLASELGVEAMSLYHHVSGKADLLGGIADDLLSDLDDDPEVSTQAGRGWRDFVERLARGVRRMALQHPLAFPLVASEPTVEPGMRAPLREGVWTRRLLAAFTAHGFDDDAAVAGYRATTSFLLGHLLLEVGVPGSPGRDVATAGDDPVDRALLADHDESDFETSLAALLDRLERLRTPSPSAA
ncbi:TetR/AcrR family transcriptional regulator C-terminal domain-containing protein [Rhodococcus aerolatus]